MAVYLGNNQIDMFGGNGIVQPTLQTKTINPSESIQNITADSGYDGLDEVIIQNIPLDHVGSGIDQRDSTDLTINGPTIIVPEGYYENEATKTIASGSATPAASLTATGASLTAGTNTLTFSKSIQNTPQVSAGYISNGTAGNSSVSLTANVTTKAAATFTPTTTAQTIAAGTYLTGAQTIAGDPNLIAANILSGKSIFNVAGNAISGLEYEKGTVNPNSTYWRHSFSKTHSTAPDFVLMYPKTNPYINGYGGNNGTIDPSGGSIDGVIINIINIDKIFARNGYTAQYKYYGYGGMQASAGLWQFETRLYYWDTTHTVSINSSNISSYLTNTFFRALSNPAYTYSKFLADWVGKYEWLAIWLS